MCLTMDEYEEERLREYNSRPLCWLCRDADADDQTSEGPMCRKCAKEYFGSDCGVCGRTRIACIEDPCGRAR